MNRYLIINQVKFGHIQNDTFYIGLNYTFTNITKTKVLNFNIQNDTTVYLYFDAVSETINVANTLLNITEPHIAYFKVKRNDNKIELLEGNNLPSQPSNVGNINSIIQSYFDNQILPNIQNQINNTIDNFHNNVNIPYIQNFVNTAIDNFHKNVNIPYIQNQINKAIHYYPVKIVTNNTTLSENDLLVITRKDQETPQTLKITLPNLDNQHIGKKIIIKHDIENNSGIVTQIIAPVNHTIDWHNTYINLHYQGEFVYLVYIGSNNWIIIGR